MHFVNSIKMESDHYVPSNSPTSFAPYQVHHNFFNYLPYPHSPTLYQSFDSRDYFDHQDAQNFVIYQKNVIARGIEDILGNSGQFSDSLALCRYQRPFEGDHQCEGHYQETGRNDLENGNLDLKLFGGLPLTDHGLIQQEWNCLGEESGMNCGDRMLKDCEVGCIQNSVSNSVKTDLLGEFWKM